MPSHNAFYFGDGSYAEDLASLQERLTNLDPQYVVHHISQDNNDFANWVRIVIGDESLAGRLDHCHSVAEVVDVLAHRPQEPIQPVHQHHHEEKVYHEELPEPEHYHEPLPEPVPSHEPYHPPEPAPQEPAYQEPQYEQQHHSYEPPPQEQVHPEPKPFPEKLMEKVPLEPHRHSHLVDFLVGAVAGIILTIIIFSLVNLI